MTLALALTLHAEVRRSDMPATIKMRSASGGMIEVLTSVRTDADLDNLSDQLFREFPWIPQKQIMIWLGMCDDVFITRLACMSVRADGGLEWSNAVVVRGMS